MEDNRPEPKTDVPLTSITAESAKDMSVKTPPRRVHTKTPPNASKFPPSAHRHFSSSLTTDLITLSSPASNNNNNNNNNSNSSNRRSSQSIPRKTSLPLPANAYQQISQTPFAEELAIESTPSLSKEQARAEEHKFDEEIPDVTGVLTKLHIHGGGGSWRFNNPRAETCLADERVEPRRKDLKGTK